MRTIDSFMNETDEQLVLAYLQGDEAAFSVLVDRYMKHLYHFARQLVGESQIAEDIVQETFLKAWKNLKRFDRSKSWKTWIFAIAKNTAYDALKKKKTVPFSYFENDEGENVLENTALDEEHPDEILDREISAQEFDRSLLALHPDHRAILILRYQDDFSLHEIATLLKEPYNTVKSRHQRALRSLKQVLERSDASGLRASSYSLVPEIL